MARKRRQGTQGTNGTGAGSGATTDVVQGLGPDGAGAGTADSAVAAGRGVWPSLKRFFSRHSPRYFAGLVCVALCLAVLALPSPYVIESPGPTQDVLASVDGRQVIGIKGVKTYKSRGKLLLLTANVQGIPGSPAMGWQTLIAWFDPHQEVLPTEAVFPVGQSAKDYEKDSSKEMTGSQDSAGAAALAFARSRGIDVKGAKVSMHVDDIGGPSAGMMYALGVIDKLTPADETGGRVIAGTGTISKSGKVGQIGSIRLKMLGARRDGATWFLAPASNCDEVVGHVPAGLRDVRVSTLADAYKAVKAIGSGQGGLLPHCTAA
ncbi:Lon protease [Bifidobacterium sp. ESL0763]|uniref:YlbL family protein n=1 Tax=Bifidobacterium sp. ESL0763 TaxID=2983227 RepID=UPI0023F94910|nr:S16 family serine protease [Bifidobacterium sp. ESL0763]MDF7664201.1 Lon protease [Bifidobacterium sp. ESL0763]